jgi:murein DD-endopeptidase MepM/ murein hydrolase activator NlpD
MAKKRTTKNTSLRNRYRFVVLNDETFEEKFALSLTKRNAFVFFSTMTVVLIALTSVAIIYTPLKYFIPGFGNYNYRSQILQLEFKADSIEKTVASRQLWLQNVNDVISGKVDTTVPPQPTITGKTDINLKQASEAEKDLRKQIEEEESFSLSYNASSINEELEELKQIHFIAPVNGFITEDYATDIEHYGIDIVCPKDEPIKVVLDGTIVSTGFTVETGYVIVVQHRDNLLSFYRHCSVVLKKSGSFVRAGEVIGMIGNTGEQSSGPHLHFELWKNGTPVNPRALIPF